MVDCVENLSENCNIDFVIDSKKRYSQADWDKLDTYFQSISGKTITVELIEQIKNYVYGGKIQALDEKMSIASQNYTTQKLLEREYVQIDQVFLLLWIDYLKDLRSKKLYSYMYKVFSFCEKILEKKTY